MTDVNAWMEEEGKVDGSITVEALDGIVKDYLVAREAYEAADKVKKEKNAVYEALENKLMTTLKAAGKKTYKVDGVGAATVVSKSVITVPKGNGEKRLLWDWISNEYGVDVLDDMRSIHSGKLTSWYNQEVERNKDNPLFSIPGIDAPTALEYLSFKRA